MRSSSTHRDRATLYILVNSCYVSRAMGVRKDVNSKSDLQGHSRALAMVQLHRPHTISYYDTIRYDTVD